MKNNPRHCFKVVSAARDRRLQRTSRDGPRHSRRLQVGGSLRIGRKGFARRIRHRRRDGTLVCRRIGQSMESLLKGKDQYS